MSKKRGQKARQRRAALKAATVAGRDHGTPERARQGQGLEAVDLYHAESNTRVRAMRSRDIFGAMLEAQTITTPMATAGRRFQTAFYSGGLIYLKAINLDKLPGNGRPGDIQDRTLYYRQQVHEACTRVGGRTSPAGLALWYCAGEGLTFREFAMRETMGGGFRVSEQGASWIFRGALAALASACEQDSKLLVPWLNDRRLTELPAKVRSRGVMG